VLRAKIVLLLAPGLSYQAVVAKLDTSAPTVGKWKKRFLEHGLDGLETHQPGQPPRKLTARLRAKILNATHRKPLDGSTHWSCTVSHRESTTLALTFVSWLLRSLATRNSKAEMSR